MPVRFFFALAACSPILIIAMKLIQFKFFVCPPQAYFLPERISSATHPISGLVITRILIVSR